MVGIKLVFLSLDFQESIRLKEEQCSSVLVQQWVIYIPLQGVFRRIHKIAKSNCYLHSVFVHPSIRME
jgi:hypothetical protein